MEDWLCEMIPGYSELTDVEKKAINDFAMCWMVAENKLFSKSASVSSINSTVLKLNKVGFLNIDDFQSIKDYFVRRYITDGTTNGKFEALNFRRNDRKYLVKSVLEGRDQDISSVVIALLIIVLRYRNNDFHGEKVDYGFHDQLENFTIAIQLLMKMMEIQKTFDEYRAPEE